MSSKLTCCEGCPRCSCILLWRISLGQDVCGPMGVDQRLRSVSRDIPVVFVVASAVCMAFICLSMKLLDFGYKENDVIC